MTLRETGRRYKARPWLIENPFPTEEYFEVQEEIPSADFGEEGSGEE